MSTNMSKTVFSKNTWCSITLRIHQYAVLFANAINIIQVEAKKEIVACDEALANEAAAAAQASRKTCRTAAMSGRWLAPLPSRI